MKATTRSLALERQALVERSALCRLRLRRQAGDVHEALGRTARLVAIAAQVFIVGKMAAKLLARFR
jgi:hypothetical protein